MPGRKSVRPVEVTSDERVWESARDGGAAHQPRQRTHRDMVTIAIQGPLATKLRELAATTEISLARLVKDMVLVYEGDLQGGYEPGTCLARWQEIASKNSE